MDSLEQYLVYSFKAAVGHHPAALLAGIVVGNCFVDFGSVPQVEEIRHGHALVGFVGDGLIGL